MSRHKIGKKEIPKSKPEIPRRRFKVKLDFGLHLAITAETLKSRMKEFNPHVYMLESAWTPKGEKERDNRELNEMLAQVRQMAGGNPEKLKAILEAFKASGGWAEGFEAAQTEAMLSSRMLRGHYVEEYPQGQINEFREVLHAQGDSRPVIGLLHEGNISGALELEERLIREVVGKCIAPRDRMIVRGFCLLGRELCGEPGFLEMPEVRVLGRFGSAHMALEGKLREQGFDVESACDSGRHFPGHVLLARLSANPGSSISRDEAAGLLFARFWELGGGLSEKETEEENASRMQEKFEGIGLAEGFLKVVSEAIGGRNPKQIKDFLKNAVRGAQRGK